MITFYSRTKNRDNTVLLIKDEQDRVFGAFCCQEWHQSLGFYGREDSFVFNFVDDDIHMYRYQGKNDKIQFSDERCLMIGGGTE